MKIIVFTQDNCGWCVRLHPHIKKLVEGTDVELQFINITDNWDIPYEHGVKELRTTPTVAVYDDGMLLRSLSIEAKSGIPGLISKVKDLIT
jgi:thiol-disulfide isomerase/thioredoxin